MGNTGALRNSKLKDISQQTDVQPQNKSFDIVCVEILITKEARICGTTFPHQDSLKMDLTGTNENNQKFLVGVNWNL